MIIITFANWQCAALTPIIPSTYVYTERLTRFQWLKTWMILSIMCEYWQKIIIFREINLRNSTEIPLPLLYRCCHSAPLFAAIRGLMTPRQRIGWMKNNIMNSVSTWWVVCLMWYTARQTIITLRLCQKTHKTLGNRQRAGRLYLSLTEAGEGGRVCGQTVPHIHCCCC